MVHINTYKDETSTFESSNDSGLYEFLKEEDDLWDSESGISYDGIGKLSSGSGVIIRSDGYIVTNYHVIEHAKKIHVILHDGQSHLGQTSLHDFTGVPGSIVQQNDSRLFPICVLFVELSDQMAKE